MSEPPDDALVCSRCGATAEGADALTWTVEYDRRRGRRAVCPACAREHIRAIEGKLDPEWW